MPLDQTCTPVYRKGMTTTESATAELVHFPAPLLADSIYPADFVTGYNSALTMFASVAPTVNVVQFIRIVGECAAEHAGDPLPNMLQQGFQTAASRYAENRRNHYRRIAATASH